VYHSYLSFPSPTIDNLKIRVFLGMWLLPF
jgi:hypothetical protein